jgi:hypothetical protein
MNPIAGQSCRDATWVAATALGAGAPDVASANNACHGEAPAEMCLPAPPGGGPERSWGTRQATARSVDVSMAHSLPVFMCRWPYFAYLYASRVPTIKFSIINELLA